MNLTTEISTRPRLSPRYGHASQEVAERADHASRSATLSGKELQQIVADMLG